MNSGWESIGVTADQNELRALGWLFENFQHGVGSVAIHRVSANNEYYLSPVGRHGG
jgi:hypothetical protein